MSDVKLRTVHARPRPGTGDICHLYDEDPNVSLCGLDISELPEDDDDSDPVCVVCEDLDKVLP